MLSALKSTTVTATPTGTSNDIWTCEAVLGTGTWSQSWSGSTPTDKSTGTYKIVGTWGAWTMLILDSSPTPSFVGAIALTFKNPLDATKFYPACVDSSAGIGSLDLTGVEVLQDP